MFKPNPTNFTSCCLITATVLLSSPASTAADPASVVRGQYLTTILGCGQCHTEGALQGQAYGPDLGGSRIGIAWSDFDPMDPPGIVFPGNLTSDEETGIGAWRKTDIVRMIRTGRNHSGEQTLPVMPWPNYALLTESDLSDIADFLMSLAPVSNAIPDNVPAGTESNAPFIRFGVYVFDEKGRMPEMKGQSR